MREILFRGKTGCLWAYGHVRKLGNKTFMYEVDSYPSVVVDPDTVGQFTGLKDKNGKKIFEGDIIRAVLPATQVLSEYVWPLQVVTFIDGAFGLEHNKNFVPLKSFAPSVTFEVIGNIHDNPELMEGE